MKADAGCLTGKACATHGDPPGLRATRQTVEEKLGPRCATRLRAWWVPFTTALLYS